MLALLAALVLGFSADRAEGAICAASGYTARGTSRDSILAEAKALSSAGRLSDARALYLAVLAHNEADAEALYGLARADAWDGCWVLAERAYAEIIRRYPRDAEVRAAWIDVLIWQGRYEEAEKLLDRGLEMDPNAPPLLLRRAKLAYFRGDASKAITLADRAAALSPNDEDIARSRIRMFRGEARVFGRLDAYPAEYPNLYTVGAQALQRFGSYEIFGGTQVVRRTGGSLQESVVDVRFPVGALFHPGVGSTIGVEVAVATPADAVPDLSTRAWAMAPLTSRVGAYLSYSFWHFGTGALVHIVNPSIGLTLFSNLQVDFRAWLSSLHLPPGIEGVSTSKRAIALGVGVSSPLSTKLAAGVTYSYGAQLDQNPSILQILTFRSHIGSVFADYLFDRSKGIRPAVGLEWRETTTGLSVWVISAELGAYVRW